MNKVVKTCLYIAGCVIVFVVLTKAYINAPTSQKVAAFEWEKTINVYFASNDLGSSEDCSKVFPVAKKVANAESLGPGALDALLKGPQNGTNVTDEYYTSINPNVSVQKFEIRNGVAYVDFDESFNQGVAGSCRVISIRSQIERTLTDLPDIDSVVISVNGQTEGILEP